MDKIARFGCQILTNKGLIKKKVEEEGKVTNIREVRDLTELWIGLISATKGFLPSLNFPNQGSTQPSP
jgi:hypothetical protein